MPKGTKSDADLDLLSSIDTGEVTSQAALSRRLGVAVGLVNALLKRAANKGYVKIRQVPKRRFAYYLTPKGFSEKSRLVARYLEKSFNLYRQAKEEYAAILRRLTSRSSGRVVLVGDGELAEIAILAAHAEGVKIAAIVIPGSNAKTFLGVPVHSDLNGVRSDDQLIITDSRTPQMTFETLAAGFDPNHIFGPGLLRLSRSLAADAKIRSREEAS